MGERGKQAKPKKEVLGKGGRGGGDTVGAQRERPGCEKAVLAVESPKC